MHSAGWEQMQHTQNVFDNFQQVKYLFISTSSFSYVPRSPLFKLENFLSLISHGVLEQSVLGASFILELHEEMQYCIVPQVCHFGFFI